MINGRANRRPTVSTRCNDYFEFNYFGKTRSHHSFKSLIETSISQSKFFLHSFFVRIIKQWNALAKEIVHQQDFSIFRSKLRKYCKILYFFFSHFLIILKFYIVVYLASSIGITSDVSLYVSLHNKYLIDCCQKNTHDLVLMLKLFTFIVS